MLDREEFAGWQPSQATLWVGLDEASQQNRAWLETESGLNAENSEVFLRRHAWPTIREPGREQILLIIRVLAADPNSPDWISARLRLWVEPKRMVSMSPRRLPHIEALKNRLKARTGPSSIGSLVLFIIDFIADSLADAAMELIPSVVDQFRVEGPQQPTVLRIEQVHSLRRRVVELQRYGNPQRALLTRLRSLDLNWLTNDPDGWRAVAEYYVESSRELDGIAEHAQVHEDRLANRTTEQMNRRIHTLTLVSTLVLPLSLVTSLLGVNISTVDANVLSTRDPLWFVGLCIGLVILGLGIFTAFRRWWLR